MIDRDFKYKKHFGQHFLVNPKIADRISSLIENNNRLIEIGPGTGNLTKSIIEKNNPNYLILIEKDLDAIERLKLNFKSNLDKIEVFNEDASIFDYKKLNNEYHYSVVGNLPYNVGNRIIFNLIEGQIKIKKCVFMLQKEVVDRICAKPSSKSYGKITILLRYLCKDLKKSFDVSPGNFWPTPKVDSSVVEIFPKDKDCIDQSVYFFLKKITEIGFSQRRKKLLSVLNSRLTHDQLEVINSFIGKDERIESLPADILIKISYELSLL